MINRRIHAVAFAESWGRQMRFITGPRQAGKTTLAKEKLREEGREDLYFLWDLRRTRQMYKENELFFTAGTLGRPESQWVCFDELHKVPQWKNMLKGMFDQTAERYRFIVTGSAKLNLLRAKLNLLRKAGDSLAGRYFTFHLFPLSLDEVKGSAMDTTAPASATAFIDRRLSAEPAPQESLDQLLEYGGFPEPFLRANRAFHRKWSRDYVDTVIREDIGTLTQIVDRERLYDLYGLLPEAVGRPISEASLARHLETGPMTVKRYLGRLEDFYLAFAVRPYFRSIKRSLLKAGKYYLYDWTAHRDPGRRFENYVASELMSRLAFWSDASGDAYQLHYIRNKEQQETDFLIVKDGVPWLLLECKSSDGPIDGHHFVTRDALGGVPLVQVCQAPGVCLLQKTGVYRISANRLLG